MKTRKLRRFGCGRIALGRWAYRSCLTTLKIRPSSWWLSTDLMGWASSSRTRRAELATLTWRARTTSLHSFATTFPATSSSPPMKPSASPVTSIKNCSSCAGARPWPTALKSAWRRTNDSTWRTANMPKSKNLTNKSIWSLRPPVRLARSAFPIWGTPASWTAVCSACPTPVPSLSTSSTGTTRNKSMLTILWGRRADWQETTPSLLKGCGAPPSPHSAPIVLRELWRR